MLAGDWIGTRQDCHRGEQKQAEAQGHPLRHRLYVIESSDLDPCAYPEDADMMTAITAAMTSGCDGVVSSEKIAAWVAANWCDCYLSRENCSLQTWLVGGAFHAPGRPSVGALTRSAANDGQETSDN